MAKAQFKAEKGGNGHDLHRKHFIGYFSFYEVTNGAASPLRDLILEQRLAVLQ